MSNNPRKQKEKERKEIYELSKSVKRANQRLASQYKQGIRTSSYKYVERQYARGSSLYSKAKSGSVKFRTDISSLSKKQQRDLRKSVETYLSKGTTTKIGLERIYKKGYDTYKDKMKAKGFNISFKDYLEMWEVASLFKLRDVFSSEQIVDFFNMKPNSMNSNEIAAFLSNEKNEPILNIKDKIINMNSELKKDWKSLIT